MKREHKKLLADGIYQFTIQLYGMLMALFLGVILGIVLILGYVLEVLEELNYCIK